MNTLIRRSIHEQIFKNITEDRIQENKSLRRSRKHRISQVIRIYNAKRIRYVYDTGHGQNQTKPRNDNYRENTRETKRERNVTQNCALSIDLCNSESVT